MVESFFCSFWGFFLADFMFLHKQKSLNLVLIKIQVRIKISPIHILIRTLNYILK